jgi:hypothetical protein
MLRRQNAYTLGYHNIAANFQPTNAADIAIFVNADIGTQRAIFQVREVCATEDYHIFPTLYAEPLQAAVPQPYSKNGWHMSS